MTIDVSKAGDFEAAARSVEAQWGGLDMTGRHTSESVVAHAIRSMECGHLYDIAHDSMEFLWFVKRLMPETIYPVFAWMSANRKWRFKQA